MPFIYTVLYFFLSLEKIVPITHFDARNVTVGLKIVFCACKYLWRVYPLVPKNEGLKCVRCVEPCVQPHRVLPHSLISKCVEYFNFNSAGLTLLALMLADTFYEWSDTSQYLTGIFSH